MTRSEIEALFARHADGFARRDPVALASDHLEQGTFESPAVGVVRGRDAIEQVYRYWLAAFPDMVFTWEPPIVDGDRAALFWTLKGTAHGQFYGVDGSDAQVTLVGAGTFRFANGGIVSVRHVFDFSSLLMATGVLKVKAS
jgi:predicted ester cyclase